MRSIPRRLALIQRMVAAALVASTVALMPSPVHAQGVKARRFTQPLVVSRSSNIIEQQGLRFGPQICESADDRPGINQREFQLDFVHRAISASRSHV